jgi:hypothetical protein
VPRCAPAPAGARSRSGRPARPGRRTPACRAGAGPGCRRRPARRPRTAPPPAPAPGCPPPPPRGPARPSRSPPPPARPAGQPPCSCRCRSRRSARS